MTRLDCVLIERAIGGERQAFETLAQRYAKLVREVIERLVRRKEDVEDISQEVFCKAFAEVANLRIPLGFSSWIAQIARNLSTEWVRSHSRRRRLDLAREADVARATLPTSYSRDPEESLEVAETMTSLRQSLDAVGPDARRVLIMHYVDGCSYDRIARLLGISSSTVKMRLYTGRKALRREMEREDCRRH